MYSYAERIRAVALYLKLGKRISLRTARTSPIALAVFAPITGLSFRVQPVPPFNDSADKTICCY